MTYSHRPATRAMFRRESWFAWFPVRASTYGGERVAWLETVIRERAETPNSVGAWRYYSEA